MVVRSADPCTWRAMVMRDAVIEVEHISVDLEAASRVGAEPTLVLDQRACYDETRG
jgi:hypothetical protein